MADVFDWLEDFLNGGKERSVDGIGEPLGPLGNVFGIGRAGDRGRDVWIRARELESEFGDVDAIVSTELRGGSCRSFYFLGLLEPIG